LNVRHEPLRPAADLNAVKAPQAHGNKRLYLIQEGEADSSSVKVGSMFGGGARFPTAHR
jgi:hypothetical protein